MSDTIFALASGAGRAAVAVVRLSGDQAGAILSRLIGGAPPPPRRVVRRRLRAEGDRTLDDALVIWFPAPASFTGEDVVELHLHGGRAVLDAVFDTLSSAGARPADAGEFSRRAFENGKLDLTQAEAIADLVDAESDAQRRQALEQLDGALSRRIAAWRAALIDALAWVEAEIDFPDEADVPGDVAARAAPAIARLRAEIAEALDDRARGERIRDGFRIALIGAPNAGKSTLLNTLSESEAAIVSDRPGTTRDTIDIRINLSGYVVIVTDTAGLRNSDDEIEREGVRRARRSADAADLRLLVASPDAPPPDDLNLDANDIVWINKADRFSGREIAALTERLFHVERLSGSAQAAADVVRLREALARKVAARLAGREAPSMTRARHRQALQAAADALSRAAATLPTPELAAEDLRAAAFALDALVGRVSVEDVLDQIFSTFCIGK